MIQISAIQQILTKCYGSQLKSDVLMASFYHKAKVILSELNIV